MQLRGGFKQDSSNSIRFATARLQSATPRSRSIADAVVNGSSSFGYQDMQPVDPLVKHFRGLTGSVALTYPLLEIGRFNFGQQHGIDYSFDAQRGVLRRKLASASSTPIGCSAKSTCRCAARKSFFDYGNREARRRGQDTLDSVNGNLGYNLRNRTRVAVNYEFYASARPPR